MGFTPAQVDGMSLWEFKACCDGYNLAHGAKETVLPPSDKEFFEAVHGEGKWQRSRTEPV